MYKFPIKGLQGIFEWLNEPLKQIAIEHEIMEKWLKEYQSVVYFIQKANKSDSPIKIGVTFDLSVRMANFQLHSPEMLTYIGVIRGEYRLESELHRRFDHLRLRGEWFRADNELLAFIANEAVPLATYQELCTNELFYITRWYKELEDKQSDQIIRIWAWVRRMAIEAGAYDPE